MKRIEQISMVELLSLRAELANETLKPAPAHFRWKNSTTEERETLERLVERSVAQLFYRK